MVDVSTANVIVTRIGTGFTIDVTACNLDADLTVKDFIIIQNNVLTSNSLYQKTSRTVLTYIGAALPTTNIEVRRKTPVNVIQTVTYASRFSSALWNSELERNARWKAETELNGSGVTGIGIPIPDNTAYSATWGSDIIYPPTRQAVYNKIETLAPLSGAAFTTSPTVPNIGAIESTTKAVNTKYVGDFYAPLTSPSLTGTPTAPTQAFGTNTVGLATTQFVQTALTPHRVTGAVAARAAVASGAGVQPVVTIPVTLPRANPVSMRFHTGGAAAWSASNAATTATICSWTVSVAGTQVSEVSTQFNASSLTVLTQPMGFVYILPLALTTTTFNVILNTRYNNSTTQTWGAFTFVCEFLWS